MYCIYGLSMYRSSIASAWLLVNSEQYAQDRARCGRCLCRAEAQADDEDDHLSYV